MPGPNISRGASERAAKALVQVRPGDAVLPGVGGVTFDPVTGAPTITQDPNQTANLRMFQELGAGQGGQAAALTPGVTGFGQEALDTSSRLLAEAGGFDPLAAAEQRYQRLRSVLEPQRERDLSSLEARLFRQGRLDSTGGALQLGEREAALAREDAMLLDRSFQEAEQARQAALAGGLQAGAAGTTVQQSGFQQALQAQQAQEQAALSPYRFAGVLSGLASDEVSRRAAAASALQGHNVSMAQTAQGGAGSAILGVAGGLAGAYFGGAPGAQAGATLGSNLGSFL